MCCLVFNLCLPSFSFLLYIYIIRLRKFVKLLLSADQHMLDIILLCKFFIAKLLMVFRGKKSECEQLVSCLNSLMPGVIGFTFDFPYNKAEFMDLDISIRKIYDIISEQSCRLQQNDQISACNTGL
jgi:hypothetical protein